jgi:hypothetical protein
VDHVASRIINDMSERTTRSRVRNNSHFAHAAFVATFEPKDIVDALSDHNWVNSRHEELERGTMFGNLLTLPQSVSRLGQNGCGRTKRERKVKW